MAFTRNGRRAVLAILAVAALVTLVLAAYLAGLGRRDPLPNVILIVLDTLRADRLGAHGNHVQLTPFLDTLAARSMVYERAYAPSSWTVPSVASLFLARYPSEHQVVGWRARLPESQLTLAEVLRSHGYRTAGFSANFQVSSDNGFDQGFDEFRLLLARGFAKGDAAQINAAVRKFLTRADDPDPAKPLFLYLQYMEPHGPYRRHGTVDPASAARDDELNQRAISAAITARKGDAQPWTFASAEAQRLSELYDGEVAYLDARLAQLFAMLDERGILHNALVVVTADHGEEFGGHGVFGHGTSLFEAAVRVPLIVRFPDETRAGRSRRAVQLAGLAPALLGEIGLPIPAEHHVPPVPMNGDLVEGGVAYSELVPPSPGALTLHRRALIVEDHKLLVVPDGGQIYYDLASDADEQKPQASPAFGATLRQALAHITASMSASAAPESAAVDDATRERLRSLGYGP